MLNSNVEFIPKISMGLHTYVQLAFTNSFIILFTLKTVFALTGKPLCSKKLFSILDYPICLEMCCSDIAGKC